jgi:hypothetical protein
MTCARHIRRGPARGMLQASPNLWHPPRRPVAYLNSAIESTRDVRYHGLNTKNAPPATPAPI